MGAKNFAIIGKASDGGFLVPTDKQVLDAIYNDGERLVPGETHDRAEIVRHKSSYSFFRKVIEADIFSRVELHGRKIHILDIGSGTGHGTRMLSDIAGAEIVGIEPSADSVAYARTNYAASNVQFINTDLASFVRNAPVFDYVVSRHALEHVEDGLNAALRVPYRMRFMVNVPFNEPEGNVHHKVNWIIESHFSAYPNQCFYYEGMDGVTRLERSETSPPNSIVCISSASELRPVAGLMPFPVLAWRPEFLQDLGIRAMESGAFGREARLGELEATLARREAQLRETEANLVQTTNNLRALEANIADRETRVRELEAPLVQMAKDLCALEASIIGREANATNREVHAHEFEATLLQAERNLRASETELQARRLAFDQRRLVRLLRRLGMRQ